MNSAERDIIVSVAEEDITESVDVFNNTIQRAIRRTLLEAGRITVKQYVYVSIQEFDMYRGVTIKGEDKDGIFRILRFKLPANAYSYLYTMYQINKLRYVIGQDRFYDDGKDVFGRPINSYMQELDYHVEKRNRMHDEGMTFQLIPRQS